MSSVDSVSSSLVDSDEDYSDDDESSVSLPDVHCCYCLNSNPSCLAMCVETKKWFCSSVTHSTSGSSHIVNHLVRSRGHTVQLHEEGPLGDTILECYNCTTRNVFTLGSVPASATSPVVVILCRACVENVRELKDMEWQTNKWDSLIKERKLADWILPTSERDEVGVYAYMCICIYGGRRVSLLCFFDCQRPKVTSQVTHNHPPCLQRR